MGKSEWSLPGTWGAMLSRSRTWMGSASKPGATCGCSLTQRIQYCCRRCPRAVDIQPSEGDRRHWHAASRTRARMSLKTNGGGAGGGNLVRVDQRLKLREHKGRTRGQVFRRRSKQLRRENLARRNSRWATDLEFRPSPIASPAGKRAYVAAKGRALGFSPRDAHRAGASSVIMKATGGG